MLKFAQKICPKSHFLGKAINKLIERMDSNQEIFEKIMGNSGFSSDVKERLSKKIYDRFREEGEDK